jgi:hypothetical protein
VADEPVRLKFSADQVKLLRAVLADASPSVIDTGERMARGEVVQRPDAEAVVEALSYAFNAEVAMTAVRLRAGSRSTTYSASLCSSLTITTTSPALGDIPAHWPSRQPRRREESLAPVGLFELRR